MTRPFTPVHLVDNWPPTPGGLERAVKALCTHWAIRGWTPHVITLGPQRTVTTSDGITVWTVTTSAEHIPGAHTGLHRFAPPAGDIKLRRQLSHVIDQINPDIAHTHGWLSFASVDLLKRRDIPTIIGAHDMGQVCARKSLHNDHGPCPGPSIGRCLGCSWRAMGPKGPLVAVSMRIGSRHLRGADSAIGISQAVADAGSAPNKRDRVDMHVISSFISDQLISDARTAAKPTWAPERPYVIHVGATSHAKGFDTLVQAATRLDPAIDIVAVGRHSDRSAHAHHAMATHRQLHERIHLVGTKPHSETLGAIRHAAAAVVVSRFEALSQTAIETAACGVPLIASNVGGLADIARRWDGAISVQAGNPDDVADAIRHIRDNPQWAQIAAETGPTFAQGYTLGTVGEQLTDLYRHTLDKYGRGQRLDATGPAAGAP